MKPRVNVQFYKGGVVWKNVVGDMARRVVDNAPDDLDIFFGASANEGDVVHYFDIGPAKQGQRPGIMGIHQISPRQAGRRLEDLVPALERHKRAVVLTPGMRAQISPHQEKVSVIPGGVDAALKLDAGARIKERQSRSRLGACGMNRAGNGDVKGSELLVQLIHQFPTLEYSIAGVGWDDAVREGECFGAAVSQRVCERAQMAMFYRSLDVFLCTSREEGGGLPILEALAAGVPVVSTSVGYANVLRDAGNPYVTVVPFDGNLPRVEDFRDAVSVELAKQAALSDEELSQRRQSISDSVREYTWDAYCTAHYKIYREELSRGE